MSKYITNFKRPLPKGSVIEWNGATITVVEDKGRQLIVDGGFGEETWSWEDSFGITCRVISIPKPKKRKKKVERLTDAERNLLKNAIGFLRVAHAFTYANVVEKAARIGGKK